MFVYDLRQAQQGLYMWEGLEQLCLITCLPGRVVESLFFVLKTPIKKERLMALNSILLVRLSGVAFLPTNLSLLGATQDHTGKVKETTYTKEKEFRIRIPVQSEEAY